ncbi:MAG TPA: SDR family oxidoreductase [Steroidobacteraceae bacterium]|nr:SDR family oxidoreductase [Steroidobacteraceae bacterium]
MGQDAGVHALRLQPRRRARGRRQARQNRHRQAPRLTLSQALIAGAGPRAGCPRANPEKSGVTANVDVRDKTLVVTGAGRGIGRALALHFARSGAQLALLDTNSEGLAETQRRCTEEGSTTRSYLANVAREAEVVSTFAQVASEFGRFDGLINNAGVVRDALLVKVKDGKLIDKMSLEQWQAVIDVNLTGVFLCAREAATHMIRLGHGGVIVNISSISRAGNIGQTNYTAAKAGVAAMTVVWAKELARYQIRVGAVAPGFIRTPMVEAMKPEALAKMTAPIPLGRLGEPEEIAQAVEFIFESELFTGRVLEIDAGLRM